MAGKSSRPEVFRREAERASASASTNIRFPDKPHPHSMLIVFKKYQFENYEAGTYSNPLRANAKQIDTFTTNRVSGQQLRDVHSIELPFPKQLVDSTSLNINGQERDPLMEKAYQVANNLIKDQSKLSDLPGGIQGLGAAASKAFSDSMAGGSLADKIGGVGSTNNADIASGAQYLLRKLGGGLGADGPLNLVTGQVLNPKETLAFQGVQLRSHQFNWDLYPSNKADTQQIKAIVDMLKRKALPTKGGLQGFDDIFLSFPWIAHIYLLGVNQDYYPYFKPAMITNITVDYGAGGNLAIMKGGAPAGVNISLSLMELEIQTAEDVDYMPETPTAPDPTEVTFENDGASAVRPNMYNDIGGFGGGGFGTA